MRKVYFLVLIAFLATLALAAVGDGAWLAKVPDHERAKQNPFGEDRNAIAAGAKLFKQHCASCHGKEGLGKDKKPDLHSSRVLAATPGELEWLLTNGSMKNGMPSWARLPEQQRWQIVSYVKSLGNGAEGKK